MRVAIVNDLRVATEALRRVVLTRQDLSIAWTAASGEEAVRRTEQDPPDVILMDLVMPGMNGAEATRQIMQRRPCPILVVTATVAGNFALVCEALSHGAFDAVATPVLGGSTLEQAGAQLLAKLERVNKIRARLASAPESRSAATSEARPVSALSRDDVPLVAIGASTGGPQAVQSVLAAWPSDFPAAVLVAQHVSAEFAPSFADWLADNGNLPVRTAQTGDRPRRGTVFVAGTDDHLALRRDGTLVYTPKPEENPFRPSVDVLFRSLVNYGPAHCVAVLLTGIGRDGAQGMLELRRAGWHTIAQDEGTSVVYGMPQAAFRLGAAAEVLPVQEIGRSIAQRMCGFGMKA